MTRTHVDESELVDIGQDAIYLIGALDNLAGDMENLQISESICGRVDALRDVAEYISDQVDALCEFIRYSRMVD